MANARKMGILAAVALFLVTLGAGIFVVAWYLWPEGSGQTAPEVVQNQPASAANPGANQIQVGLFLSNFTATGPHRSDKPYGYETQLRPVKLLRDPSIHLLPVIEPRTRGGAEMTKVLWQNFPGVTPLDASRVEDLGKLDVLVATAAADVPDEVLKSIDQSVRQGMGLVQRQLGYITPGYTPQIDELCGFSVGTFGWNARAVECEVVGNHPLLGGLAGKLGATIQVIPNGTVGRLKGFPLLRVKDMKGISLVAPDHSVGTGEYLYPLYISQLGRGRIVGIGFSQTRDTDMPAELEAANNGRFYIHCVQWLAGRTLQ
ncbi:MAG: hypothetical protein ABSB74_17780 [Tepidisphaeraceae bacterium]